MYTVEFYTYDDEATAKFLAEGPLSERVYGMDTIGGSGRYRVPIEDLGEALDLLDDVADAADEYSAIYGWHVLDEDLNEVEEDDDQGYSSALILAVGW